MESDSKKNKEKKEKENDILIKLKNNLVDNGVSILEEGEVEKLRPHIGEGGFGKVYKGNYGNQVVAIKKILLSTSSEDAAKDIINEIAVVMKIKHERIPKFFGLWESKKRFHLIFEFIDGPNLKKVYMDFPEKTRLMFMSDVCDVLSTMHAQKIIHRDVKPSNVMLDKKFDS